MLDLKLNNILRYLEPSREIQIVKAHVAAGPDGMLEGYGLVTVLMMYMDNMTAHACMSWILPGIKKD
jgi:hypothetical protein